MAELYHNNVIDVLKLGGAILNVANICLQSFTIAKFHPFTLNDKSLLSKVREDMIGGPSIVFTPKAVLGETHICNPKSFCKPIVRKDASQIYSY